MKRTIFMTALCLWASGGAAAMAQTATPAATSSTPVAPVANACQRFAPGSVVQQPPALFSQNGVLNVESPIKPPPITSAGSSFAS